MDASNATLHLNRSEINLMIGRITVWAARKVAHIQLRMDQPAREPETSCCTVYTTTKGAYQVRLALCANRKTLCRIMEGMLGEPSGDPDEMEEAAKEFFNVLCGNIVSEIARKYRVNVLFSPPQFALGGCPPPLGGPWEYMSFAGGGDVELYMISNWRSVLLAGSVK